MKRVMKAKIDQNSPQPNDGHDKEVLWKERGLEDVYFQRSALVNFWTVLGGIAVAALLTQMTNLIEEIQKGRWYLLLYFLAAIMMIVHSWVNNLWGGLVLRVKITMLHTFIQLLVLISLAILCLQVTNPLNFFAIAGLYILFAIFLLIYLMKSGTMVDLSPERIKGNKITIGIYVAFTVLSFVAVANLFWVPSVSAEISWGIFAIFASIAAMLMQHYGMEQERRELGIP
jgi:hypothetical protein